MIISSINRESASTPVIQLHKDDDITKAISSLVSAFEQDPYLLFCFGSRASSPNFDIRSRLTILFTSYLKYPFEKNASVYTDESHSCVAVWFNPGTSECINNLSTILLMIKGFGFGGAWRLGKSLSAVEKQHPHKNHAYLWLLGTREDAQGKGVGGKVIQYMLKQLDKQGIPSYLKSPNLKNVSFYHRQGFKTMKVENKLMKGCPPMTLLWREPEEQSNIDSSEEE